MGCTEVQDKNQAIGGIEDDIKNEINVFCEDRDSQVVELQLGCQNLRNDDKSINLVKIKVISFLDNP